MSTPFARTYVPSTYRSSASHGTVRTAAPARLAQWTFARGLSFAVQVLFFAATAGRLTTGQLIVAEIAAGVLATGAAEALKSAPSIARPQRARYGRALTEFGMQCALAVLALWLMAR